MEMYKQEQKRKKQNLNHCVANFFKHAGNNATYVGIFNLSMHVNRYSYIALKKLYQCQLDWYLLHFLKGLLRSADSRSYDFILQPRQLPVISLIQMVSITGKL